METAQPTKKGRPGRKIAIALVVAIAVAAGLVFLYGSSAGTRTQAPSTTTIIIPDGVGINRNLNFKPATIFVVIGVNNTIKWVDQDPTPHTVTSTSVPPSANSFDSGTINNGQSFTLTLTVPGTYSYFCTFHPSWMKATITVKAKV